VQSIYTSLYFVLYCIIFMSPSFMTHHFISFLLRLIRILFSLLIKKWIHNGETKNEKRNISIERITITFIHGQRKHYQGRFALYHGVSWFVFDARVKWKGSIESIIGKRAVDTDNHSHVCRIKLIKGLFRPFAKNSTITIAAFMNAYVQPNELRKVRKLKNSINLKKMKKLVK